MGVGGLRRGRGVSELLFLYECATADVRRLQAAADRLGLTVQAVSHLQQGLRDRGLLEHRADRYRPTVKGVAWLQAQLTGLGQDVDHRLGRLKIVRVTRAIAAQDTPAGAPVHLEMVRGLLTALHGAAGSSKGRTMEPARRGELVAVDELEGIVPITVGPIVVAVVPGREVRSRRVQASARRLLRDVPHDWVGAQGIEAIWLAQSAGPEPVRYFGVAAACREAATVGAASLVFVADDELPRFLEPMAGPGAPPFELRRLDRA